MGKANAQSGAISAIAMTFGFFSRPGCAFPVPASLLGIGSAFLATCAAQYSGAFHSSGNRHICRGRVSELSAHTDPLANARAFLGFSLVHLLNPYRDCGWWLR